MIQDLHLRREILIPQKTVGTSVFMKSDIESGITPATSAVTLNVKRAATKSELGEVRIKHEFFIVISCGVAKKCLLNEDFLVC
jgi:hypothetical protein